MAEWLDVGVYDHTKKVIKIQEYAVPQEDIDALSDEGFMLPTYKLLQSILMRVAEPVSAHGDVWKVRVSSSGLVPYCLYSCFDRKGSIDIVVLSRSMNDYFAT